ncbi:hypothetical protein CDAR_93021 [Caerostris darwini]|uniref:Uncharacterized protein n=1 Tax=Caerostris darwini TaxID=1538125 RepID=A0AAV4WEV6_9ARAC|nr:hypothetical protein CDAR_93021 [Caerostris darwini]
MGCCTNDDVDEDSKRLKDHLNWEAVPQTTLFSKNGLIFHYAKSALWKGALERANPNQGLDLSAFSREAFPLFRERFNEFTGHLSGERTRFSISGTRKELIEIPKSHIKGEVLGNGVTTSELEGAAFKAERFTNLIKDLATVSATENQCCAAPCHVPFHLGK